MQTVEVIIGCVIGLAILVWVVKKIFAFDRAVTGTVKKLSADLSTGVEASRDRQWAEIANPTLVDGATCPTCHKDQVRRLQGVEKALFGPDHYKTFICMSCKYRW